MRRLSSLVLAAAVLCAAPAARASVAVAMSIEELTKKADLVVRAHVTGHDAAWTRGGRIVTTAHLAVDGAYKGQATKTLDVRHLGGHVGTIGQDVAGEVHFTDGEEVVLFLRAHPSIPDTFVVLGMSQGKFSVSRSGTVATAAQQLGGLGLVRASSGAIEDRAGERLELPALEARIAHAAAP